MATSMAPHWTTLLVKSIDETEKKRPHTARPHLSLQTSKTAALVPSTGPRSGSMTSRESKQESHNAMDEFGKLQLESTIHKAELAANDLFRSVTSQGRPSLITYKRDTLTPSTSRAASASHASTRPQSRLPQFEFLDNPAASRPTTSRWSPELQKKRNLKNAVFDYDGVEFDMGSVVLPTGFLHSKPLVKDWSSPSTASPIQHATPQPAFSNAWPTSRTTVPIRPQTGHQIRKVPTAEAPVSPWHKDSLIPGGDSGTMTGRRFF